MVSIVMGANPHLRRPEQERIAARIIRNQYVADMDHDENRGPFSGTMDDEDDPAVEFEILNSD